MNINLDKYQEIIEGKSLGGVSLGEKISNYSELLEKFNTLDNLEFEQDGIYSTVYKISDYPIEIYVDTRTGLIYKLSALQGYLGSFKNKIKLGISAKELLKADKNFYYSEFDEAILSKTFDGIVFEVEEDDPLPYEVEKQTIVAITIFIPDIFKPSVALA